MSTLDHTLEPKGATVRRLEVITGTGRRRRFSADDKARIIEETLAPGAVVSDVARRHGLSPQQLFTWRRQARRPAVASAETEAPIFVPAVVDAAASDDAAIRQQRQRTRRADRNSGIIEVKIEGASVRVGPGAADRRRPADRGDGRPGAGLQYADHLPLYRQAQIYARQGVTLDRSTLTDWVGRAAFLLRPVYERPFTQLKHSEKLDASINLAFSGAFLIQL